MIHLEKILWDNCDFVLNLKLNKEQKEFVSANKENMIDAYFAITEEIKIRYL